MRQRGVSCNLALELYDNENFGTDVDDKSVFLDAKLVNARVREGYVVAGLERMFRASRASGI